MDVVVAEDMALRAFFEQDCGAGLEDAIAAAKSSFSGSPAACLVTCLTDHVLREYFPRADVFSVTPDSATASTHNRRDEQSTADGNLTGQR